MCRRKKTMANNIRGVFNQNKKIILVVSGIAAALLIAIVVLVVLLVHNNSNKVSDTVSTPPGNIILGDINADGTSRPSNADVLASLKTNPDYLNPRTDIPFAELFRNSEQYKGDFVHYTGKVVQVLGDSGNWNLRVNITKTGTDAYPYWNDTVFIFSYSSERVIEKDIIEFTAQMNGTITYQSALGSDITIPSLTIYEHKLVGRNE